MSRIGKRQHRWKTLRRFHAFRAGLAEKQTEDTKSTEGDGRPAANISCQKKDSLHLFIPNNRSLIVPAASDPISSSKHLLMVFASHTDVLAGG